MRNKNTILKHLPPTPLFFPGSTSLPFLSLLPPPPYSAGGQEMGAVVRSSHVVTALLVPQGEDTSHSFHPPAWGPTHRKQYSMNFSNSSPSHGLQLFTNCPSLGPFHGVQSFRNRLLQRGSPQGHKPCQQTCSSVGSSLHGSVGPGRSLLQCELPMGLQLPSGIHLLQRGVPSTACRGTACLTMVFIMGCRGLRSGILSTSSPSFFTDLGVSRAVSLTSSHSSLQLQFCRFFFRFSELHYPRGPTTVTDGLGLGQLRVRLGAGWHWLCWTWEKLLAASHRRHPCSYPVTNTLPHKPNTVYHQLIITFSEVYIVICAALTRNSMKQLIHTPPKRKAGENYSLTACSNVVFMMNGDVRQTVSQQSVITVELQS